MNKYLEEAKAMLPHLQEMQQQIHQFGGIRYDLRPSADLILKELRELDLLTFWRYYRDAIIYQLKKSDAGQDYLKQAYNSEQTKPDRAGLAQYIESQK